MTPTAETAALKSCPFCGDKASQLVWTADNPYVECAVCGGQGPYRISESASIASWNKRPVEDALVGALEEISKGEGPYSRDRLKHAENTIESMKDLAQAAIKFAKGE